MALHAPVFARTAVRVASVSSYSLHHPVLHVMLHHIYTYVHVDICSVHLCNLIMNLMAAAVCRLVRSVLQTLKPNSQKVNTDHDGVLTSRAF